LRKSKHDAFDENDVIQIQMEAIDCDAAVDRDSVGRAASRRAG